MQVVRVMHHLKAILIRFQQPQIESHSIRGYFDITGTRWPYRNQ